MIKNIPGKRLQYLREKNLLTQDELAGITFFSRSYIGNVEKGTIKPSNEFLNQLASHFCITKDYYDDNHEEDLEISEQLNNLSQSLLNNDLGNAAKISQKFPIVVLNPQQELFKNLLIGAMLCQKRDKSKLREVDNYLSVFLPDSTAIITLSPKIQMYYYLYWFYRLEFESRLDECLKVSEELRTFSSDKLYQSKIDLNVVNIYLQQNRSDEAFILINKIIPILEGYEMPDLLSQAYINLSRAYGKFQLYDKCLEVLERLDELIEKHRLIDKRAVLAQHRGFIYSQKKEFSKALKFYEEAYSLPKTPRREITLLNSLISASLKQNDIEKAGKYLILAKEQSLTPKEEAIFLSYEGELHLLKGKPTAYLKCQEEAIAYFKTHNYKSNLEYIYLHLAKYHLDIGKHKKAAYYFNEKENLYEVN